MVGAGSAGSPPPYNNRYEFPQAKEDIGRFGMTNQPFGRQPQPVTVVLAGEQIDIDRYMRRLQRAAESNGESTNWNNPASFTIYPRAVND